jgi:hypothetical protein
MMTSARQTVEGFCLGMLCLLIGTLIGTLL